jgi:hypothetical protein
MFLKKICGFKNFFSFISDEQVLDCSGPHEHLSKSCCAPGCAPTGIHCDCVRLEPVCHCDLGYTRDAITHECKECQK